MTEFSKEDLELIEKEFDGLRQSAVKRCATQEEFDTVLKAFEFANKAHYGVRRHSGEPYIIHPISVAKIVVDEIGLGCKSIVAALLHDVVEDTEYTSDDIKHLFGEKVASLVEGLTKIKSAFNTDSKTLQAENFKKILLTLNDDTRIILIKLADRLHNLRTIDAMPDYKREKILSETMYIFIPLAHRLGLYRIKIELENIWMRNKEPEKYLELKRKIEEKVADQYSDMMEFIAPLEKIMRDKGYNAVITARKKTPYSVWKKMMTKNVTFEEVYDIYAARIVFQAKEYEEERLQAWKIYTFITSIYPESKVDRIRDWVSKPKINGYEALHCTVMSNKGAWIEVQIRSERMDAVDERGLAAHWLYKKNNPNSTEGEKEMDKWLVMVRDILDNPDINARDFLGKFHEGLVDTVITVFTPKGKNVLLPKGATALDFAYEIHSEVGDKAIAAKINYKLQPLSTTLINADQVEIITAENQTPQRDWLTFVRTEKAKTRITNALKEDIDYSITKGHNILVQKLEECNVKLQSRVIKKLLDEYHLSDKDELYSKIASKIISLDNLDRILKQNKTKKNVIYWTFSLLRKKKHNEDDTGESELGSDSTEPAMEDADPRKLGKKRKYFLKENIDHSLSYLTADCCNPIPGDPVVGFMDSTGRVIIHKKSCTEAQKIASEQGERIVNVIWTRHTMLSSLARIKVLGIDRVGALREITKRIAGEMNINIRKILISAHDGIFEGYLDLYVYDTDVLNNLIKKLSDIQGIENVSRADITETEEER